MEYDAKKRCCGFCYGVGATMKCARCPRAYCSRDCQVKDWKVGGHKVWCGNAGEKCVDYEIREAGDKGLGLFTMRDYQSGEKILVERAVMTTYGAGRPINRDQLENRNVLAATMALAPTESTALNDKFEVNCAALGDLDEDSGSGVFVNFSRVNHECLGNSDHRYDVGLELMLLVATQDIPAGSEVTFSYACNQPTTERALIASFRGFQCTCRACQYPDIAAKLDRTLELNDKIFELGSHGRTDQAIQVGRSLINLYDELQLSDMLYVRTYYDMYQVAITKQKSVQLGSKFIREAYRHALRFYGRGENREVQKFKRYSENPSLHRNYRCIN
ncbi:hypothetical protein ACHAXR_005602 [Thalassiosira sp. AJA248-18]